MAEQTYHQIHLVGKGFSGRAVRYVTLDDEQVEKVELTAAREVGKEGTNLEMWSRQQRIGMETMIRMVSDPVSETDLPKARWSAVTAQQLHDGWKDLFTNKDTKTLKRAYDEEHEVRGAELDIILGKKMGVLVE